MKNSSTICRSCVLLSAAIWLAINGFQFAVAADATKRSPYDEIIQIAIEEGTNPWEYAIRQPGTTAVGVLVQHGRDINEIISDSTTPLILALQNNRMDAAAMLIRAGARDLKADRGATVVAALRHEDSLQVLELLLRNRFSINNLALTTVLSGRDPDHPRALRLMFQHGLNAKRMVEIWEQVPIEMADAKTKRDSPGIIEVSGDRMIVGENVPHSNRKSEGKAFILKVRKMSMFEYAREHGTKEIVEVLSQAAAR